MFVQFVGHACIALGSCYRMALLVKPGVARKGKKKGRDTTTAIGATVRTSCVHGLVRLAVTRAMASRVESERHTSQLEPSQVNQCMYTRQHTANHFV